MRISNERRRQGEGSSVIREVAGGGRDIVYGGGAGDWWVHFTLAGRTRLRIITWLCTHAGEHTEAAIERALGLSTGNARDGLMAMRSCSLVEARMVRRSGKRASAWHWRVTECGRQYLWRYGWVTGRLVPGSWTDDTFEGRVDVCPCEVLARDAVASLLRPLALAVAYALWQMSPVSLEQIGKALGKPSCYVRYFVAGWQKRGWVEREAAPESNYRVTRRRPKYVWRFTREGLRTLERHVRALRWAAQNSGYDVPPDDRFLLGEDRVGWYTLEYTNG